MHQICPKKCQCIDLENKEKVCGMYDDNLIYECAGPCPACHKCHQNVNNIQLTYLDFCNQAVSQDEKQKGQAQGETHCPRCLSLNREIRRFPEDQILQMSNAL